MACEMSWLRRLGFALGVCASPAHRRWLEERAPKPIEPPTEPTLVSWQRLGLTDYLLTLSDGQSYRGWSAWWREAETAKAVQSAELVRLFTLIEWGKMKDKERK